MKPAPFVYHRAATVAEATALLAELGEDAQILAGGQSLVPMMNLRLARPAHLVDVNPIAELAYVEERDGALEIGALTRHHALATSELVARRCPVLAAAAANIGHYAIRQRGTIGGSLALADPAAELPLVARLFDAAIELVSGCGARRLPAGGYFAGIFATARAPDELLTAVRVPVLEAGEGWGFRAFARRPGDFFLAAAAVVLRRDAAGRVARLRLALGGVGPIPLVPEALLAAQVGRAADAAWAGEVARAAARAAEPDDTPHASAVFKRELAEVLARRALLDALARTAGGGAG